MKMTAISNFHGFVEGMNKFTQLRNILHLQSDTATFQLITADIHALVDKHIDPRGYRAQYQQKSLMLIEQELREKYPQFFKVGEDCSRKLYFARRAAISVDGNNRRLAALVETHQNGPGSYLTMRREGRNAQRKNTAFIDLSLDSSDESEVTQEGVKVPLGRPKSDHKAGKTQSCLLRARTTASASPQKQKPKTSASLGPSNAEYIKFGHVMSMKTKEEEDSVKVKEEAVDSNVAIGTTGIYFVHRFLSACKPSMEHFLHKFLVFGCSTEAQLRSLSQEWSAESRQNLLRQILGGRASNGREQGAWKEIDVAILNYHLETYFL